MASLIKRKHAIYIQLNGLLSIVSFAIVATSLGTQGWIDAIANPNVEGPSISDITYGLFKGTLIRRPLESPNEYELFFTCIWTENSCAWSCERNADLRELEVQQLLDGETPNFSCLVNRNVAQLTTFLFKDNGEDRIFTNAGLWLSTIIFLVILLITLFINVVLSIVNCMKSPIETFFNIQGIYVANGIAIVANFFALMLYGICYDIYMKKDISIRDTIVGEYSSEATLGYSYWILLPLLLFHAMGIALIARREIIINSDRAETKIDMAVDIPATGVLF